MSVISVRLNTNEEKILERLSEYFNEDKSSLIKHSLRNLYEAVIDSQVIDEFERKEKQHKVEFVPSDEILDKIK